ncbi:hypothetical protein MCUN1_001459 [Malassezia cuniculi]|uniref:Neuroguidin n=1 Tax=Malassezia cuniculi TaxID=948313 RepID=A0AAF0J5V7_9BASI|nr:hypothetical protein MCUN1_001459 [Malassezia cuniculi]
MTRDTAAFGQIAEGAKRDTESLVPLARTFVENSKAGELSFPDGLSLLTVKVDALMAYMHHLVLLCAHKLRGHALEDKQGQSFVEQLVRLRLLIEKIRPMETRLKYQIEKLVRTADTVQNATEDEELDPLAFRPNPQALAEAVAPAEEEDDGTYRPPKVAPVVYDPDARPSRSARNKERMPSRNAALLADLSQSMSSNPYETSTGGVGGGAAIGAGGSSRARALRRMEEFEEDNYKRLSLGKRDNKRRRRDEADVALGGIGLSKSRIGGGIEEEFGDLLRERKRGGDIYAELGKRARAPRAVERAKANSSGGELVSGGAGRKFKKAVRQQRRRAHS